MGEGKVRNRDSEKKDKGKKYAGSERNAIKRNFEVAGGDKVLLKQEKKNTFSTYLFGTDYSNE